MVNDDPPKARSGPGKEAGARSKLTSALAKHRDFRGRVSGTVRAIVPGMDSLNAFTMPEEPVSYVRICVAVREDEVESAPTSGVATARPSEEEEVRRLLPIVHAEVARFLRRLPRSVLKDDLMLAGTIGLLDALRRGGPTRDARFEQYVRIRVRGAILDEIRREDWLSRAERSKQRAALSSTNVVHMEDLADGCANAASDNDSPADAAMRSMWSSAVVEALQALPSREREILELQYLQGWRAKDIAQSMGVSEPRISQLHARAVGRLREALAAWNEEAA